MSPDWKIATIFVANDNVHCLRRDIKICELAEVVGESGPTSERTSTPPDHKFRRLIGNQPGHFAICCWGIGGGELGKTTRLPGPPNPNKHQQNVVDASFAFYSNKPFGSCRKVSFFKAGESVQRSVTSGRVRELGAEHEASWKISLLFADQGSQDKIVAKIFRHVYKRLNFIGRMTSAPFSHKTS